jgi:SAM-dependent methyltransferase
MHAVLGHDFSSITEQPAQKEMLRQMAMLATRYGWAASQAGGKDVLEAACGAGLGLGWLAQTARSVEAGDWDQANCRLAAAAYPRHSKIRVRRMDAMSLPFEDESFELALLLEAVYYLPDAERFFGEARRVLRRGGRLLIATVNREWRGFHPSPFSTRYLGARELKRALSVSGFETRLMAGFPEPGDRAAAWIAILRSAASALGLMPRTMAGKAFLKRLFYGPLEPVPPRLEPGMAHAEAMIEAGDDLDLARYRVLYAEATKI